ncbi:MAG TPA: hypothetical protein VK669_02100 [Candidatus Limnocylindrales bacterium]|nr:hypothetical protein [Candidatus Limnocylindrales bacterium]
MGSPLDGLRDTPGDSGNEVNDVFVITQAPTASRGAPVRLGFVATTFNHEQFYQFPIQQPGMNQPIVLNIGPNAIRANSQMPAAAWFQVVDQALAMSRPTSPDLQRTIAAAKHFEAHASRSGTVSITSCFDAPWDGRTK